MKTVFTIIAIIILGYKNVNAQDPTFSQFYNNPLYFNPGFTGINSGLNLHFNFRPQWPEIPSRFRTFSMSADLTDECSPIGLGLLILNDNEGEGRLRNTSICGSISAKITLGKNKRFRLQPGLQFNYIERKIDWDKLEFSDQINPYNSNITSTNNIPPISEKVHYSDGSVGFVSQFEQHLNGNSHVIAVWLFGGAISHFHSIDQAFYNIQSRLPTKKNIQFSCFIPIGKKKHNKKMERYISPYFQLEKQSEFREFILGGRAQLSLKPKDNFLFLYFGLGYRSQSWYKYSSNFDSFIIESGFRMKINQNSNELKIGFSYDLTVSLLARNTFGTPELSIKYSFVESEVFCKLFSVFSDSPKHKDICPHF